MAFIYGLITMMLWTIVAYWTQETAHEVARKYAVQEDNNVALEAGYQKMNILNAGHFIDSRGTIIEVSAPVRPKYGDVATSKVTVVPSIQKLYIFNLPKITRTSEAMLEDHRLYYDDPNKQYIGY